MFVVPKLRSLILLVGALALGGTMILAPPSVAACPFRPPRLYNTSTTFHIPPLPAGIAVEETVGEPAPALTKKLRITNTTSIPLYIIGELEPGNHDVEPLTPQFPAGRGPILKIVDGRAWEWANPHATGQDQWIWRPLDSQLRLDVGFDMISMDQHTIAVFPDPMGEGRPANVTPPPPETIELSLVYGTQLIPIPMTVTYTLNPAYTTQNCSNTRGLSPGWTIVIGMLAAGSLGALIRPWLKRE